MARADEEQNPQDILQMALAGILENPNDLLTILYNRNLDFEKLEELWEGHLNNAWLDKVNEKIKKGFTIFRIQTEFQLNGHETHIYMAKMKQ